MTHQDGPHFPPGADILTPRAGTVKQNLPAAVCVEAAKPFWRSLRGQRLIKCSPRTGEQERIAQMMTAKQRVMAAADHKPSDRTPLTFDAQPEVYDALHRHLGTETGEQLFDRLHVDTWFVGPRPVPPEGEGSIWGFRSREVRYDGGSYWELAWSPLAGKDSLADIRRHRWPADEAMDFSAVPAEAAAHRDRAVIGGFGWGAFFRAFYVRGMENLLLDFALRPKYAECLIETITERNLFFLDRLLEAAGPDLDIVYVADDYCSQDAPLVSPEAFRRFIVPYVSATADRVHQAGKKLLLHCCGAVRPLLGMIIDAGVDILEPIQVRAAGMDAAGLKRDFGRDLCFYGGVDLQRVLPGPRRGVADEVRRLIDALGQDGGYILGPGHTYIQVDAPLENILTMYDTARRYRPWTA
jgi:uroporphyrinogen decarboxylase